MALAGKGLGYNIQLSDLEKIHERGNDKVAISEAKISAAALTIYQFSNILDDGLW